ncbi:hypothetical protein N7532_003007 [Penicillium argentinense]|uniref:Uncharacterized protein n=1 Tax=Penicillium argentinense TaxID=1131581 RepID=A0A9W9KE80_9EURO|nr:uncharacterized protein N7532_003007 [Penicillium argentinense]KAJ5102478.1 hypothetical protein N7532_003007 [Penicillium argentinense]
MALSIEFLRQYSNRHHGVIHLKSYEDLANVTSGVYTYVPTAFAILAVALWNICALDVLRLEPFFQLAKPEGASGSVLFTNYCFFYGILTPIMAVRNRHWVVASVASMALVLRVMLPSILSGLVNLDEPTIVATRHLNTWPKKDSTAVIALHGAGCQTFSVVGVLVDIDATSKDLTANATTFGCLSTYLRATADITLPKNSSIADATNLSADTTTLTATDFSISAFQNLLYGRYHANDLALWNNGKSFDYPAITNSNDTSRPTDSSLMSIGQYQDGISRLWNQHFLVSMGKFFNTTTTPTTVEAKRSTDTIIYSVTSHSALVAEALLLSAFLLLLLMAFFYPLRPNFLLSDPGSIVAQCALVTDMFSSLDLLTNSDIDFYRATPRQLRHFSRSLWCRLVEGPNGKSIEISRCETQVAASGSRASRAPRRIRHNARPHFLTPPWFLIECFLMAGVLGAFGVSFQFIRLDKFDTSYSAGTTILALFLIYGPTVIASMISSLFVSVHRHIGTMEPWVRLREGMALAGSTLTVNYGSHTPLTIWRQFRENRPPLLIMLSAVCLLDFSLTIVSSGMFEPSVDRWTDHTTSLSAPYNASHFDSPTIRASLSGFNLIVDGLFTGNSLLSWTTTNFSFFPLEINDSDAEYTDWTMYSAQTRGIGVELLCSETFLNHSLFDELSDPSYWTYMPAVNTSGMPCTAEVHRPSNDMNSSSTSLEFSTSVNSSLACQTSFVVARYGDFNDTSNAHNSGGSPTVFHCSPKVFIDDFEVHFDPDGMIQDYQSVSGGSVAGGQMFHNVSKSLAAFNQAFVHDSGADDSWPAFLTSQVYDILGSHPKSPDHSRSHFNHHHLDRKHRHKGFSGTEAQGQAHLRDVHLTPTGTPHKDIHIPGTVMSAVWEITPSNTTIVIIIILLSLDLSVLMAVFWLRHGHYTGPPFPPLYRLSRALGSWTEQQRKEHLECLGHRYKFGEWGGADGRIALDYDEKLTGDEDYEMGGYELPRVVRTEEAGAGSPPSMDSNTHEHNHRT